MNDTKPRRLLAEERRREILGLLDQNGRITIDEIVEKFGISAVTARSDLAALSDSGELVRSHGGGLRPLAKPPDFPLRVRETIHHEQKAAIAEAALRLIRPGQTVILCTGSTSIEIARALRRRGVDDITIITHALNIAAQLADLPGVSLVMIGGILRQVSSAFVGPQAEHMMQSLHADHCFLSTVGLDVDAGMTTLDIMEAQLNRCMIANSAQVSVIADSSKFGHRSLSLITGFQRVQRVITDGGVSRSDVDILRRRSVEVLTS